MRALESISGKRTNLAVVMTAGRRMLQRKCACGGSSSSGNECEECKKKKLQRRAIGPAAAAPPPIVDNVLRSPGRPLDSGTRAFFEPYFGHDFSKVRVHTDHEAAKSARAVNALAYTVGEQIVFGAGQFSPASVLGQHLLAHELTHVVQQDSSMSHDLQKQNVADGDGEDHLEKEAESNANNIMLAANDSGKKTAPSSKKPAPPKNPCTRTILSEGRCSDLVAGSKFICCDPDNGVERPGKKKDIDGTDCPSQKFTPIFTCDHNCPTALKNGCSDDDNWMAVPPGSFSLKHCGEEYTICANGKQTTGYVRDRSITHSSFEVSPKIQTELGVSVGDSFKGSVYRPGAKQETIDKDPCCKGG
jgi:uncharacterized protein DUF4157